MDRARSTRGCLHGNKLEQLSGIHLCLHRLDRDCSNYHQASTRRGGGGFKSLERFGTVGNHRDRDPAGRAPSRCSNEHHRLVRRGTHETRRKRCQRYLIANSPGLSNPAQGLGTNNNLIIRGVATGAGASNSQSTMSFMLDDIDLNPGVEAFGNANPKIVDVQHVEILRGPQGTLFGAGSLSSVVRYISNRPDLDNFSGSVEATGSSADHGGGPSDAISGVLNAPLIEGKLAARLVASTTTTPAGSTAGNGASRTSTRRIPMARVFCSARNRPMSSP